jgi:hypothetical protein
LCKSANRTTSGSAERVLTAETVEHKEEGLVAETETGRELGVDDVAACDDARTAEVATEDRLMG